MASEEYPPFTPNGSRFDQSEYWGRFKHFKDVTDPSTLFVSDEKLQESIKLIKDFKEGTLTTKPSDKELWEAKKIVDAIIHSDTGEKIPLPFRLSAFLPVNVIICAGLITPNPTVPVMIFWQWLNQSYNIMLNHANRNASNEMTTEQILQSYGSAVAISCGVALGLKGFVDKVMVAASQSLKNTIKMFIPFAAVSLAGCANVAIMRRNEMKEGIQVKDADGNVVGMSPNAGKRAIAQVCVSRVLTSLPALVFPPIALAALDRVPFIRANPRLKIPLNLGLIAGIFYTSLPAAVGIFPQQSSVSVEKLEPQFQNLKDKQGNQIHTLYYNKGL